VKQLEQATNEATLATSHPSYLELDRMLLGAPAAALATTALAPHLAGCERCRAHVARVEAGQSAGAAMPAWVLQLGEEPSREAIGAVRPRGFQGLARSGFLRSMTTTALGVVAAFGGWLWLGTHESSVSPAARPSPATSSPAAPASEAEPYVAAKGDPGVAVYLMRGGRVFSWNGSESVRSGDRIRLGVAPGSFRHVAVYTRKGGSVVTLYRGELNGATDLPAAWTVDEHGEAEQMVVVLSARPLADAELAERDRRRAFLPDIWARELVLPKERGSQP
jgi:hypothetical protein